MSNYKHSNIRGFFKYLLRPRFWFRNYSFNADWDRRLNEILDSPEFENMDNYWAEINGVKIWIANYPYAYGQLGGTEVMPSRETVERLHKAVIKHRLTPKANDAP